MGFENSEQSRVTYVGIFEGKLTIRAKEDDEGAVKRKNKNGKEVWEFHHDKFTGTLVNVECIKSDTIGFQYVVWLDDFGTSYKLSISVESKYGDNFASKLLSLKKGDMLTLAPYDFKDKNDKKNVGISITRGGEKIPALITKDNPMGRPQPTSDKMDEDEWKAYMIVVRKFYKGLVDKWQEKNANSFAGYEQKPNSSNIETAIGNNNEFDDDLGFKFTRQ